MDKTFVVAALAFVALAIVNLVVYIKLSKYLYISAGVTKEDAQKYAGEQGTNATYRLGEWLRRNAKHPKEFGKMFTVCNISSLLSMACFAFAVYTMFIKNNIVIIVGFAVLSVISLGVSAYGFSYGRNLETRFENFYSSSEYTPYEGENVPDEIESLDELYLNQESELKRQSARNPVLRFFPIVVILIFVGVGVVQMMAQSNDNSSDSRQTEGYGADVQELNIVDIRNKLNDNGFVYYEALNEMTEKYPDVFFSDCSAVYEPGMRIACCVLNNENTAVSFQQTVRTELEDDFRVASSDREQTADEADFAFYSLKNKNGYAFSFRSGYIVVCAKADADNSDRLEAFLASLGVENYGDIE